MKRLLPASIALILITFACTERIDITLDDNYTRLVVDGSIANDTGAYTVKLTKTADYFYNEPAPLVVNAQLLLTDGIITYAMEETIPGVSGIYQTRPDFSGIIGKTYTMDILLDQEIDEQKQYHSTCHMMKVAHIDSVAVSFREEWGPKGIWEIRLWAQEPGDQENYYMFHYYRNDTLITDSIGKISISDDRYFNGNYINGVTAVYINNENVWETLKPGDKVTLQMSGITREYYDFISQVQMAGYNIPFFTGPPANVTGNISHGAIGFFAAYSNSWGSCIVPE